MGKFPGEEITEEDRDNLTAAAYLMQELYQSENTWYDAIHKCKERCPKVMLWQLEGMWRAIDAYVDINE